jgi:3-phenylpropionate/cinnamic acid dioxygenase small subunit
MAASCAPGVCDSMYLHLAQFLYREAALLDARDWDGWGKLFDVEGVYWVPAARDQVNAVDHVSLVYDSTLIRDIRVARLKSGDAISFQTRPNSSHLVSNIVIAAADERAGHYTLSSRFVVAQSASWGVRTFHGAYTHELVRDAAGELRISLKRVDLVDVESPQGDILTIL